jgi:hypothetical protein
MLRISSAWPSWLATALLMVLLSSLGGCSNPNELSPEQAAALEQRVTQRWQTIINRDFDATWDFSSPNYREVFPRELYRFNYSYGVDWELTGVDILHYDSSAAVASVGVRVMTKPTKPTSAASKAIGALPATIREQWIRIEGEWWHSANK